MAWGKFLSVQMGMDFSGGSCDDEYDSVRLGSTTCQGRAKQQVREVREI